MFLREMDEQFSACEEKRTEFGRIIQTVERGGESTRFRKPDIAQNDLSVGRKYWSSDTWIEDEHRWVMSKHSLPRLRRREVHTACSTVQRDDAAVYDDEAPHERALYYSEKMKTKQASPF
ncbi:hypothetical protein JOM56_012716 [Amanita muscaria]